MEFKPFKDFLNLFSRGNDYYNTPKIPSNNYILSGQPEFLNPDTWNAYNIYMTTAEVYAVINRLAHLQASGTWKHYKLVNDEVQKVENSDVINLLENPNPLMKGNQHIIQAVTNLSVYGNNYEYMLKAFDNQEIPDGLTNLNPSEVGIQLTGKSYKQTKIEDIIEYYELQNGNSSIEKIETNYINHTKVNSTKNGIKGESPLRPIYMEISNIRSAYQFRNVIMNKRGALGILSNKASNSENSIGLTKNERERLEKQYQKDYGIDSKQMQVIMSNASLEWQPMSFPTKDLMLFEEVESNFKRIIDHFGLNDNLFSKEKASTFNNLEEGLFQAYQSTVIPQGQELANRYAELFGLTQRGEWLERDFSHIKLLQQGDKEKSEILEKKANAMAKLKDLGLYTDDELKDIIKF